MNAAMLKHSKSYLRKEIFLGQYIYNVKIFFLLWMKQFVFVAGKDRASMLVSHINTTLLHPRLVSCKLILVPKKLWS